MQNDMISLGGDGDRWRTNAFELSVGDFSFGSYIYTNDGKADSGGKDNESRTVDRNSPIWGKNRNKGLVLGKMDKFSLLLYGLDIEEEIRLPVLATVIKCFRTCNRTEFTGEPVLEIRIFI